MTSGPYAHSLRTVWLSDVHLGSRSCRVGLLLDFLRNTRCETLYLVGDIIDLENLRRNFYWPASHTEGDAIVRGRSLGVLLGALACRSLLALNHFVHWLHDLAGRPYWSLAQHVKSRFPGAKRYVERFQRATLEAAREARVDGVVCGHIHRADLAELDGLIYCNDGDWVESCTALVEDQAGALSLLAWRPSAAAIRASASLSLTAWSGTTVAAMSRGDRQAQAPGRGHRGRRARGAHAALAAARGLRAPSAWTRWISTALAIPSTRSRRRCANRAPVC